MPSNARPRRGGLVLLTSSLFLMTSCVPPAPTTPEGIQFALALIASGIPAPTELVFPDDDRMFVASQTGQVWIVSDEGQVSETPLLDLSAKLVTLSSSYDERGLLGLALHPDFAENGRLFVYYVAPAGDDLTEADGGESRVAEFILPDGATQIDADTERIVLRFGQPQATHNAGKLAFGQDGYLYIATGDGGGRGDSGVGHSEQGNAQDPTNLLGKILRIGVDGAQPYEIPADNPLVGQADDRAEIWAYGLRNPWKFAFDVDSQGNERLLAGDVGQSVNEEINLVVRGGNYGWRVREGTTCVNTANLRAPLADCPDTGDRGETLIDPIIEYARVDGTSVVGGEVYRGSAIPDLVGAYVFGDFTGSPGRPAGRIFVAMPNGASYSEFSEARLNNMPNGLGAYLYGFARSPDGEVYVYTNGIPSPTGQEGRIYKLEDDE